MDEQALNDAYNLFTRQGYNGTINQFKKLISTNNDALNDSYQIFRAQGYNGDINNYSTLVGVKKKTSSTTSTPDSEVGMEDLQNGFDFSPTIFEAPAVLTPKKQKEYIAEQKLKPVKTVEPKAEDKAIPKGWETYQAPSKEGEQGLGLNLLSSLNRSIYKNFIGSPIKALGTFTEKTTALLPRQIRSETGKGIISESLIEFGDYFNKTIDEISPQDEEFKNTLTDQFAQAFGQVVSTIMTAGVGGAISKGLSLTSKGASMVAKPLTQAGAAIAATKEAGKQIIGPAGISSALTMGQSEYDRAKEAGATDEQAFEAFYKNAVTGSVLETIPVMQFMKRFNQGTKGGLVNYIKTKGVAGLTGGVEEMTTEVLQTIYANKTAQEIYNENQDIFEGIKEAGGIGFGVGFLLNAMGANAKILRKEGKDAEADVLENQIDEIQSRIENGPPAVYKINGLKIESPQIVSDMIDRMDAPDLSKLNIEIDNDPVLKTKLQDKIITSSIMAQVREANPELNEPSLNAITELEKQLTLLEGNKTQTGKDKAAAIRTQIKNIQENQLQEEAVAETVVAETPELAQQRIDRIAEIETTITNDDAKIKNPLLEGIRPLLPAERTKLETELETLKTEQDAIQEQAAGQVPVLTETGVSETMEGGEPKAEPKVLTEEVVQEEEVKAPEITRESIRSLTDEEVNPLYDEIPMRLLPTAEGVSKQDAVFEAYFKSKQNNTNPELVQAVESSLGKAPEVSLKTQPIQEVVAPEVVAPEVVAPEVVAPEVVEEEQFVPITAPDIQFDIRFSRDNASDVVEDEREGDNGRTYNYISEIETPVSNEDGDQIGYLVKMTDSDKNLTFEARDENGSNLSKNDEGFPTLGEARQALLDNLNKAKKKEFTKEAKAKAKAKEKEVAKAAKAKAKAETKKPTKPVVSETIDDLLDLDVADQDNLDKIFNALDNADKFLDKAFKGGAFELSILAIPIGTIRGTIIIIKTLVKGGMLLRDAIKKVAADNNISQESVKDILNVAPIQEEFSSLMEKADALIARQKRRNIAEDKIVKNLDVFIRNSEAYKQANDAQKKIMEREARAKMGVSPKRAVSIGRVLGALKDITNISREEKMLIIKQIRDLSRDAAKELGKELREMASSGKINAMQAANIVARFGKVNMLNEMSVSKFVDYMANMFANAEYASKIKQANNLRKDIKKLSRNKEKNANLRDLAKKFSDINPSMVEDIDAYNEMASKIKEAVKGSTIRGQKVNFANTVNIENATEYINKALDTQNEKLRQERINEIQDLMGVDVSELSYDEMMMFLDGKETITKYNEGIIRGTLKKMFDTYSGLINSVLKTGKDPFTDEDVEYTDYQKDLIKRFMDMNLDVLTPKEALQAIDALANFFENKSTAKMEAVVSEYKGLSNSKELADDGIKARLLKKYGSTAIGRFFAEQTTTLPVLIEKMFPGVSRSRFVMKMMGLTDLINKSSAAKTEARNIVNDYVKEFYKRTANGEAFNTVENDIERGMASRLMRTIIGTEAEMQAEFNRRKEILKESIAMLSEGNEKEVALSILYQKVYDKLVGPSKGPNQNQKGDNEATNIQEVKDRVDKTNLEAIDFWIKNWGDRYDRFSEVSEGVYNTILEKDLNYTPDKFSLLSLESESIELGNEESAFQKNSGQLYDKKSATLNKVTQPGAKEIRKANRYLNLSFDQNMANLMQDALIDVNTAASIKQVNAFLNSPNFRKIFPNQEDALIIKGDRNTVGRVQLYVNNLRNKNNFTSDELSSAMRKLDKAAAFGVSLALGTISQVPKQTLSVAVNTLINSGRLPDLSTLTNIDKINFINNSGRDIANRGIGSQAEIESINKLIEKAASSTGEKAMKLIEEANSKWINLLLVKPDVAIARGSWLTYYEQSLRKQGIDTKGLDYKTHELNDEAADYASTQVGRQQNISDHDLSGKLFSNEQALAKWFVKTMMAFSSFRMNAASRLGADLTTLNDKTSTKEDRLTAARSIAGFGAELATFKLVSIVLTVAWGSLTKLISGEEEDEEEFNKRKRLAIKAHRSSVFTDVFSPLPIIDPFMQKFVAAPALNKIEEVTGLPVSIYATPNNKSIFAELGSLGIAADRVLKIIELGKLAATGKYTDDYGNEQTIPEKKRESLIRFVPLSILASVGVIPQEGNTLAMNAMKYAKSKSSYNDSLTRRALDRWSSSVDLEEYPQVAEFIENKRKELAGEGDQAQQREELNKLKKSLLEGYDDKNQMNAVEPELYRKNFGENSDWVKKGYAKKDAMESKYNSALSKKEKMIEIEDLKAEEDKIK